MSFRLVNTFAIAGYSRVASVVFRLAAQRRAAEDELRLGLGRRTVGQFLCRIHALDLRQRVDQRVETLGAVLERDARVHVEPCAVRRLELTHLPLVDPADL